MPTRPRDEQPTERLAGFGPTRVFRAASMREAFARVKEAIGPEAVLLSTRDLGAEAGDGARFEVAAAGPSLAGEPWPEPRSRSARDATIPDAARVEAVRARGRAEEPPLEGEARERELTRQLRQLEQAVRG